MKALWGKYVLPLLYSILIFIVFIIPIVYYALLRILVVGLYPVPSESMLPTIIPGDVILVNKLKLGSRVILDMDYFNHNMLSVKLFRLPGYGHIERNDVIVFNYPYADSWRSAKFNYKAVYVKRCIGLPGDTISIANGFYKIAGYAGVLGNRENQENLSLFPDELVDSIPGGKQENGWSFKNYGPLYIPKSGDIIFLDSINQEYYSRIIEWETGEKILKDKGLYFLNGKAISSYTVKNNYYFVAGDNVSNSRDSRFWGLLQEDYIIGVVPFILYSRVQGNDKLRWNRMFKSVAP